MKESFKKFKTAGGYTIIEAMIAISLFTVIVMSGMGALLNANLLHQKSEDMRSIIDNMSFVMEDMSRNLKTGYNYQCFRKGIDTQLSPGYLGAPRSCADGWAIAFESDGGKPGIFTDQWVYYVGPDPDNNNIYGIFKSANGAQSFIRLTPAEVEVYDISGFSVLGAEPPTQGDKQQPLVTIRLVGKIVIPGKNVETPFSLQTSASHRLIDI